MERNFTGLAGLELRKAGKPRPRGWFEGNVFLVFLVLLSNLLFL